MTCQMSAPQSAVDRWRNARSRIGFTTRALTHAAGSCHSQQPSPSAIKKATRRWPSCSKPEFGFRLDLRQGADPEDVGPVHGGVGRHESHAHDFLRVVGRNDGLVGLETLWTAGELVAEFRRTGSRNTRAHSPNPGIPEGRNGAWGD